MRRAITILIIFLVLLFIFSIPAQSRDRLSILQEEYQRLQAQMDYIYTRHDEIREEAMQIRLNNISNLLDAMHHCEGVDNIGLMQWDEHGNRSLMPVTHLEARREVVNVFGRYIHWTPNITLLGALKRYAPPFENPSSHYFCVLDRSGLDGGLLLNNLLEF